MKKISTLVFVLLMALPWTGSSHRGRARHYHGHSRPYISPYSRPYVSPYYRPYVSPYYRPYYYRPYYGYSYNFYFSPRRPAPQPRRYDYTTPYIANPKWFVLREDVSLDFSSQKVFAYVTNTHSRAIYCKGHVYGVYPPRRRAYAYLDTWIMPGRSAEIFVRTRSSRFIDGDFRIRCHF